VSALDRIISPEISSDRFSRAIAEVASVEGVAEILEIGSSSGAGSTEAWIAGALRNASPPRLHCIEVSIPRYEALVERVKEFPFVSAYNVSSVDVSRFPTREEVERFYRETRTKLRRTPLATVLEWLQQDLDYVTEHGLSRDGILEIKQQNDIDAFDAVLIDGSEFTGRAELDDVYGARFLLLDDTMTFKNWDNCRRLDRDPSYRRIRSSRWTRNGFSIFERT
jgi:hypothetical protein